LIWTEASIQVFFKLEDLVFSPTLDYCQQQHSSKIVFVQLW